MWFSQTFWSEQAFTSHYVLLLFTIDECGSFNDTLEGCTHTDARTKARTHVHARTHTATQNTQVNYRQIVLIANIMRIIMASLAKVNEKLNRCHGY